jgi:transcriptional regulator with XRE-family HTH domain
LRKEQNLTQYEVAAALDVTQPIICTIERDERYPTLKQLRQFAVLFRVPIGQLAELLLLADNDRRPASGAGRSSGARKKRSAAGR